MGLDAHVMCDCFRKGKTTPPPFPREWLEVDEEGYFNLAQEHDSAEGWAKLMEWQHSCCDHEDMDFACEFIANWFGLRLFQDALGDVGWDRFPILQEQLPEANGGLTPPGASGRALRELEEFESVGEIGTKTVLVDTATGEAFHQHNPAYGGVFILQGSLGVNVGIGEFEFFAVDARTGEELFRATRVEQARRGGSPIEGDADDVVWKDLDTGEVYASGIAISGKAIPWDDGKWQRPDGRVRFGYPARFHVERRPRLTSEFESIVRALRVVFSASVATGNPVRWS
ncbi:hypothetical protein TA3x_005680 [Tundrisphaera sp. TA3]|uniref:hypothetical protein n=1 Tax=Tundrisphaera sp. TA3 TaxID=3435775 RepID=UPI003EBA464B